MPKHYHRLVYLPIYLPCVSRVYMLFSLPQVHKHHTSQPALPRKQSPPTPEPYLAWVLDVDIFLGKARVKSRCFHTVGFSPPFLFLSVNSGSRVAAGGVPVMWCDVRWGSGRRSHGKVYGWGTGTVWWFAWSSGREEIGRCGNPLFGRAFVAGCDGR